MKIGVIGCGVVGGTLVRNLIESKHTVLQEDPAKNLNDDLTDAEAIFLCVPVPTDATGKQNVKILKACLEKYRNRKDIPFYIRSSVIPKTCDHLGKFLKMQIFAMPEFLTERTATFSFDSQPILCGVEMEPHLITKQRDILKKIFPNKEIFLCLNREAELAKYAHNCMGAIKVNFFNLVAKYAKKIGADYENVIEGVRLSGYINGCHTEVPGPDGKHGFGGKCFPKDMVAFLGEIQRVGMQAGMLQTCLMENMLNRTQWEKDYPSPSIKYIDPVSKKAMNLELCESF